MNNIEIEQLKKDVKEYLGFSEDKAENIYRLSETKLVTIKNIIRKIKNREHSNKSKRERSLLEEKVNSILKANPKLKKKTIIKGLSEDKGKNIGMPRNQKDMDTKKKHITVPLDYKPKILFICDVMGWAWWIKSHYLKKYLSEDFRIDIKCVLGDGCQPTNRINQNAYDLYFSYGFSYIDFLYRVPKHKKITGITAHRRKNVIFPKMRLAGHHHANSKMLLKELHDMGFKKAYYIPNGVDEELFRPIEPIKRNSELIVGHVGKECPVKGQREFILPAIKSCNAKSVTNLKTWKDRIPHKEMPDIYNKMDVFVVASIEDGTPNPALEAAACGRPIISNQIGNMPEFIKDGYNGFIVERKIGEYVKKIKYFQENRDELIRMGNNARKTVLENWTWEKQAENYRNMFHDIFKRKIEKPILKS
jgi:glycosyltransferase involved in cell wall biosynthesis